MRAVWTILLVSGMSACSDYQLDIAPPSAGEGEARIVVDPLDIDFHTVSPGESELREITIDSVGVSVLMVHDLEIEGAAAFTVLGEGAPFELEPGESRVLEVAFSPEDGAQVDAVLTVSSNDDADPQVPVTLSGRGLAPELQITPETWDFGALGLGCTDEVELILQNVGLEDLEVTAIEGEGGWFGLEELPLLPLALEPGALASLTVTVEAGEAGVLGHVLRVSSDDPYGDREASQEVSPASPGTGSDRFTVPTDPEVDVLFAIDRSGSMDDDAAALAEAFSAYIDAVGQVTTGWQLGVVTMDDGCFNGGVLTADSPDLAATFSDAVQHGEDDEIVNDEALLHLADRALQLAGEGDCNEGFLRDESPLHLIVVSDEPDRSDEQASAWTWDYWLDRYQGYVSNAGLVTVSGVIDVGACGEGSEGYADIIDATGGQSLDLCTGDWAEHAAALADATTAFAWSFPLSADASESSIVVEVDGVEVSGWHYDAEANAVVFDDRPDGDEVVVSYELRATCD